VLDHRGREVSLEFGEARVLAPEGELAGKPQLALVGVADSRSSSRRSSPLSCRSASSAALSASMVPRKVSRSASRSAR
jgi:hypothetical protein